MKTSHILVTILLAVPATAVYAQDDTADAAFKRGEHALKAGRIHEACDAFAASEKLAALEQAVRGVVVRVDRGRVHGKQDRDEDLAGLHGWP